MYRLMSPAVSGIDGDTRRLFAWFCCFNDLFLLCGHHHQQTVKPRECRSCYIVCSIRATSPAAHSKCSDVELDRLNKNLLYWYDLGDTAAFVHADQKLRNQTLGGMGVLNQS